MKVNSSGPVDADIFFVGEAPGSEEERRGIPFCNPRGAGGEFDDRYLHAVKEPR